MNKIFSIGIAAISMVAATSNISFAQDAKAKAVLDKLSAKIQKMNNFKADFNFVAKAANGSTQMNQTGTFLMKGSKFKVVMPKQELICDGKNMWTYLKSNKEVQVATYNPNEQNVSPAKLFSGSYAKDFTYTYSGTQTVKGKQVESVVLIPKTAQSFKTVVLFIDKEGMLVGGSIAEKSGASYTYTISNVKPGAAAADVNYTFDANANKGVEVIDLR